MTTHDIHATQAELDNILSAKHPDTDALDDVYTRINAKCQPHEEAIATIDERLESEELSELKTNLLWTERRRHEAAFAPLRVMRERIEEEASLLYAEAELDAKVAETAAKFSVRSKVEAEKTKIHDDVCKLAGNIVHGVSPNAAWQTRRSYEPAKPLLEKVLKEKNKRNALTIAADLVEAVKPRLLAKFSAHTDLRDEFLAAFVAALKK